MLARNSVIVFAAVAVSSATSFVFQVLMGRNLTLDDFGQLSAFLSLQTIFSVPVGALIMLYSRHAAVFSAAGNRGGLKSLYSESWRVCGALAAVSAVLVFAASRIWQGQAADPASVSAAVATLVAVYFIQAAPLAFIRGTQKFHLMAVGLGGAGLLKLGFAAALIWGGALSVSSAVSAIAVGVIISIVAMHLMLWPAIGAIDEAATGLNPRRMFLFALSAMAGTFFPMLYLNVDMLLVRALVPAEVSGHYGAFTVIGKGIFLLGQVVGMVLFPAVAAEDVMNLRKGTRLAGRALLLLFAAGAVVVAGISFFSEQALHVILKVKDERMAALLPFYCLSALAISLLFLEANHRLARQEYRFLWIGGAAAVLQSAGIAYFSGSVGNIVKFQVALFWCVLAARLAALFRDWRRERDVGERWR